MHQTRSVSAIKTNYLISEGNQLTSHNVIIALYYEIQTKLNKYSLWAECRIF